MKNVKAILILGVLLLSVLLPMIARAQSTQSVTLGWTPSSATEVTGYYLYYGNVASTVTNRVDAGLAVTATLSNLPVNATYFFYVTARDSANNESDPSNLITFTPAVVTNPEYPDLAITALTFAPSAPVAGNAVSFSAVIANQGTQPLPAGSNARVSFKVDGGSVVAWVTLTNSLAPGATTTVAPAATWTATSGSHIVLAIVDDLSAVTESAETNNQFQVNVSVATAPVTLPIVTLTVNQTTVAEADTNGVLFTVQRSGATTSSLTVGLKIEGAARNGIDYALLANSIVIPAGQSAASFRLLPVRDGVVDSGKDVSFTVVANSAYQLGTPKTAAVTITNSDTTPQVNPPDPSQRVTLAWTASPDSTVVGYNIYYGPVAATVTNKLNVGLTLTTTITNLQSAKTYFFFATSYNASGVESDPSNVLTYTTPNATTNNPPPPTNPPATNPPPTSINLPDLAFAQVSYLPLAPVAGDTVRFRAVITNRSTTPLAAGVSVRVSFAIDGGAPIAWRSFTGPLTNGTTVVVIADKGTASGTWRAVGGAHTITAAVDDLNAAMEITKTNNTLLVPINVQGAPRPAADLDSDGDGLTDIAESIAGTDPNSAASSLRIASIVSGANGELTFTWASVPGIIYRVVQRETMSAAWTPASEPVTAKGTTTSVILPTTNAAGFFALEVIPAE
jgi:hypothetical protein